MNLQRQLPVTLLAVAFSGFLLLKPSASFAQNKQGQSVVTAGAGASLVGILFTAVKELLNTDPSGTVTSHSTPVIVGSYDYALADKFSLGAAYSYQSVTANYDSYYQNDTLLIHGDFKDRISRQNIGLRPLFHFGDNEKVDGYFGGRVSYTMWKYTSNVRNDVNLTKESLFNNRVHVQALVGGRYFFSDFVGANLEFAIGPSYYAMFGLNVRF